MQTYSAKLRLSGSLFNELRKDDLTAPEITILKKLHGSDAVVEVKAGKHVDRTDEEERARLAYIYDPALKKMEGIRSIDGILGPEGVPLAKSVSGVDSLPPPKAGRRAAKPDAEPEAPVEPIGELEFN